MSLLRGRRLVWRVSLLLVLAGAAAPFVAGRVPDALAALQSLKLTSMCSPDPDTYRVWRVRNYNELAIEFTWVLVGTPQTGVELAPAAEGEVPGIVYFNTNTVPGPNTTKILVDGVQHDVKASNPAQCPTPTPIPSGVPGDVNGDGLVNTVDVGLIGLHWLETGAPGWIPEDVNSDGVVNTIDVGLVGLNWLVA